MNRLTEIYEGIVVPSSAANCSTHQFHCEDCECKVSDCAFLRAALNCLADYEDTGLTPEQVAAYAKAEAEGRLIMLPCKVGTKVFWIANDDEFRDYYYIESSDFRLNMLPDFGKIVFLTREEAEAALKEAQG